MSDHPEEQPTTNSEQPLARVGEHLPTIADYVTTEANLEVIGYFDAGYKRRYPKAPDEAKTVQLPDGRTFRVVPSSYGYPNTDDLDFYRGFQKIIEKRARATSVVTDDGVAVPRYTFPLPITFSTRELLIEAGREESQPNWRGVRKWIKRNTATTLEGKLKLANRGYVHISTHLFDRTTTTGETLEDGTTAETHHVWPAPWFLDNYASFHLRTLDVALHRRLKKQPIAKTLYPILSAGWYATRGQPFRKVYADLAQLLGIPTYKHLSKIKHQLDEAHGALKRERLIARWQYDRAARDRGYVVAWWPGEKWREDEQAREERRQLALDFQRPAQLEDDDARAAREARLQFCIDEAVKLTGEDRNRGYYATRFRVLFVHGHHETPHRFLSEARQEADHPGKLLYTKLEAYIDEHGLRRHLTPSPTKQWTPPNSPTEAKQQDPPPLAGARPPGMAPGSVPST